MEIITNDFPDGLILYRGLIPFDKATHLYNLVNNQPWTDSLSRQVQQYGYIYDYTIKEPQTKKLEKSAHIIPPFLKCLQDALYKSKLLSEYPNQIIVNKYLPGQGIGAHRDHNPIFADSIATISLGSGTMMEFQPYKEYKQSLPNKIFYVYLEIGDILIFRGDARMKYSHEIKKRKTDIVDNKKISRRTRISLTFRHVNKNYQDL